MLVGVAIRRRRIALSFERGRAFGGRAQINSRLRALFCIIGPIPMSRQRSRQQLSERTRFVGRKTRSSVEREGQHTEGVKTATPCRRSIENQISSSSPPQQKYSPPLRVRGHKRCASEAQRPQADHSGADTASGDGGVAQVAKDAAWRRRAAAIQRSSGE